MINDIQTLSLLPYLCDDGGKLCLNISHINQKSGQFKERAKFIQPDYTDDALTVGYNAQLCTDLGFVVKQVTLLTQRDHYPILNNHSPLITNSDIEERWQHMATQYDHAKTPSPHILFKEQFDSNGAFLPFSSLFFCTKRKLFFHPPCPRCGKVLSLCRDDELLEEFGLAHYSKSLRRYVYCPTCTPLHGKPWYAKTTTGENNSAVQNCTQLILDFGSIDTQPDIETHFPCVDCSSHKNCFTISDQSSDTIQPFSFYPFYMVITGNISCNGQNYLAMVSGASTDQLSTHWRQRGISCDLGNNTEHPLAQDVNRSLHPPENSHHFFEVLYLKLQFIKLVAEDLLKNNTNSLFTEQLIPTHTIGISLDSHPALPLYWGISLSTLGLGVDFNQISPYPKKPDHSHAYIIGLLWLVSLLSNKHQGDAEIIQKLNKLLEESPKKDLILREIDETFLPYQIFWSSNKNYADPGQWSTQWDKILSIGYNLLHSGYHNDPVDSKNIVESINVSLSEVKKQIFAPTHKQSVSFKESTSPEESENVALFGIIDTIQKKWQQDLQTSQTKQSIENSDFTESISQESVHLKKETPTETEDPEKTIMMSARSKESVITESTMSTDSPLDNHGFDDTHIVAPRTDQQILSSPPETPPDDFSNTSVSSEEELEKTVRIKRQSKPQPADTNIQRNDFENKLKTERPVDDDEDNFLTETVVLRPKRKNG